MSRLIAFAAIQGGYKVVSQAEGTLQKALQTYDADTKVGFPNTGYFLPVIYSLFGIKVETLEDLQEPLGDCTGSSSPPILKVETGFLSWGLSWTQGWQVLYPLKL